MLFEKGFNTLYLSQNQTCLENTCDDAPQKRLMNLGVICDIEAVVFGVF